jgi:hypothetical protein
MKSFGGAIGPSWNPAQIYISILPFSSLVLSHCRDLYPHILHVKHVFNNDEPADQPLIAAEVQGHHVVTLLGSERSYTLKVFEFALKLGSGKEIFSVSVDFKVLGTQSDMQFPWKYSVAISRNGNMVAVGKWRCDVFNIERQSTVTLMLPDEEAEITCLQISPNGERVVAGFRDGRLHEWDLMSGSTYRTFQSALGSLLDEPQVVAWTVYMDDRGDIIASNTHGHPHRMSTIRVWQKDGSCSCSLTVDSSSMVDFLTFGMTPCIGYYCRDKSDLYIREILTEEIKFKSSEVNIPPPMRKINRVSYNNCLATSADGRLVIVWDESWVCVWDCWEKKNLATLVGHSGWIAVIAFIGNPSTYQFVSVSNDGTIRLWDLQPLLREDLDTMGKEITSWSIKQLQWDDPYWITDGEGEILFCLSKSYPFRHPLNTVIIGKHVELDPTHFVYGKEWTKCREPINAEVSSREVTVE